ncbi:MAG: hypothetical protein A2X94_07745 [Bdellovibrionales bacterium GWB1_55_8]|nr:MAG: hypothetical protein A2X94_07745 [Bdellovibrionales bacterium GWB1_55_8]
MYLGKRLRAVAALVAVAMVFQTALVPVVQARSQETLLNATLDTISTRYDRIFAKIPQALVNRVDIEKKANLAREVTESIARLKDDQISTAEFRDRVLKLNQEALQTQKDELIRQIQGFSIETLNEIASVMEGNRSYAEAQQEYMAAFTRKEKADVISRVLISDLDHQFSMMNKRSARMTQAQWILDLERMQSAMNTKGDKRWLKVLGYAVLGIAAVGLVSWGVANSVYSGRYQTRKTELDREFEKTRAQLEAKYNELNQRLSQEQENYLQESGYVWTTCGNYEMPDSILCNGYDYALFQGTKFCSVQCYRHPASGKETMHSAPTCTSPYIPADCYDPSEYDRGWDDGYSDGSNDGSADGRYDGDEQGSEDGWYDGQEDGWMDGYDDGYAIGFNEGYTDYFWGAPMLMTLKQASPNTSPAARDQGYKAGLSDGRNDAKLLLSGTTRL